MVCFCYRRRFVAPPRSNADSEFVRRRTTGCYLEALASAGLAMEHREAADFGSTSIAQSPCRGENGFFRIRLLSALRLSRGVCLRTKS